MIREQAGAATLERIEGIRQTAVHFRRADVKVDAVVPLYGRVGLPTIDAVSVTGVMSAWSVAVVDDNT